MALDGGDEMQDHKSFFVFLAVLALAGVGFGYHVSTLQDCGAETSKLPATECHRLYLAFGVLFAVGLLLSLGAAFYVLIPTPSDGKPHPGKDVFDTLSKSLLPVVTLVLGYFFGNASSTVAAGKDKATVQIEKQAPSSPSTSASKPNT
jgi:hypothetical protein